MQIRNHEEGLFYKHRIRRSVSIFVRKCHSFILRCFNRAKSVSQLPQRKNLIENNSTQQFLFFIPIDQKIDNNEHDCR